jgi:hypothetical protein
LTNERVSYGNSNKKSLCLIQQKTALLSQVGHVPKPKTFAGVASETMTLAEFADANLPNSEDDDEGEGEEEMPNYIFDGITAVEASRLLSLRDGGRLALTPNITNLETLDLDGAGGARKATTAAAGAAAAAAAVAGGGGGGAGGHGFERGILQFSLGAALSGTPLHWHNDAVNHLVRGRKLWTLQPPAEASYSRVHAKLEAAAPLEEGLAFRCVQEAGDVIYVPDSWGHGVLNLEESAAYASTVYGPRYMFVHPRASEPH